MNTSNFHRSSTIAVILITLFSSISIFSQTTSRPWITAYYTTWGACELPPQNIDFNAVTHIVHQSLDVTSNTAYAGRWWKFPYAFRDDDQAYFEQGVGTGCQAFPLQRILIDSAHAHGVKVILGLGANEHDYAAIASDPAKRAQYVQSVLAYAKSKGYDGVDVDWEFVRSNYRQAFIDLMAAFRAELNKWSPRGLLTVAVPGWYNPNNDITAMNQMVDQVNLMTYDMSGYWEPVTGYNAPIYDPQLSGYTGGNAHTWVNGWIGNGLNPAITGFGVPFYGLAFENTTGPAQGGFSSEYQVSYNWIMARHNQNTYRWDNKAEVPYLSVSSSPEGKRYFITYDDSMSLSRKVSYAKNRGLGGIMIFELWRGLINGKQPLMDAVRKAAWGSSEGPIATLTAPALSSPSNNATNIGSSPTLIWQSVTGASSYQVQISNTPSFATLFINDSSVSVTTKQIGPLSANATYYWRVRARNNLVVGEYSSARSFTTGSSPSTPATTDNWIYDESIRTPWVNHSWGGIFLFDNMELPSNGSRSIKSSFDPWGALSFHSGGWTATADINTNLFASLSFSVYNTTAGATLRISFENNVGSVFPSFVTSTIPVNQWTTITVPMSQLNPTGTTVHRLLVQNYIGTAVTMYFDDMRLVGNTVVLPPPLPLAPFPLFPENGATNQFTNLLLRWSKVSNATNYHLQAGTDSTFAQLLVNNSSIADTVRQLSTLLNGVKYFWRVRSINNNGVAGSFSSVQSFTTMAAPTVGSDLWLFQETLVQPWINASWGSTVAFSGNWFNYAGMRSVRVTANGWGAFRLRSSSWTSSKRIAPQNYSSLEFYIYTTSANLTLRTYLANESVDGFRPIVSQRIPPNQWTKVSYRMNELNPAGLPIQYVVIQNNSATPQTFYIDNLRFTSPIMVQSAATRKPGTEETVAPTETMPLKYSLDQNYPNPFNPGTEIRYQIADLSQVTLRIYDALGQEVTELVNEQKTAGVYSVQWDGGNMPSGIYFCELTVVDQATGARAYHSVKRMVLMK